ncbi:MAG: DUF89 family protein [Thermoplasmata archaeon]|nr:MAG: DUF89 family protein [Thermoplasmata archaeon]
MKIRPKCVPCLLNRALYETDLIDSSKALNVIEEACRIIGRYDLPDSCSAVVASEVHKATYEILGTADPYKTIKDRCNQIALYLLPKAEKMISESQDKLKAAILCSIIGNVLDFGIPSSPETPEMLAEHFDNILSEGLGVDDSDKLRGYLEKGGKVLYFADNCGEIVFDKLLCRGIKKFDIHLTFVARGEPILTDATLEDVREFGLDEVADEVLTTGCYAVGVDFNKMGEDLRTALDKADLIISKGMANYETFSETEYRPIAHLLRTKCAPVAEDMGLETDINVVKLYE